MTPSPLAPPPQVLGLARNDASAASVKALGATPVLGSLTDLDILKQAASSSSAVIHLGFIHDFSDGGDYMTSCQIDAEAVEAMLSVLEGTGKTFIGTSGTLTGAGHVPFKEADTPLVPNPRVVVEKTILATKGIKAISVRLAPSVHGPGEHGFVPMLIASAQKAGASAFIDEGTNVWPAAHVEDVARLYVLALDKAPSGSTLHGAAENLPFGQIARAIGDGLSFPTKSLSKEEAGGHFGFLAMFCGLDNPTSAEATKELVGWEPREKGLMEELKDGTYI